MAGWNINLSWWQYRTGDIRGTSIIRGDVISARSASSILCVCMCRRRKNVRVLNGWGYELSSIVHVWVCVCVLGCIDMQDRDNRLPHSSRWSDVARFEYARGPRRTCTTTKLISSPELEDDTLEIAFSSHPREFVTSLRSLTLMCQTDSLKTTRITRKHFTILTKNASNLFQLF